MRNLIKTLLVMLMLSFSHAAFAGSKQTFIDMSGNVFLSFSLSDEDQTLKEFKFNYDNYNSDLFSNCTAMIINGEITGQTFKMINEFKKFLNTCKVFAIKSTGGNLDAGIEISKLLFDAEITVYAHDPCYSTCAFIYISAAERSLLPPFSTEAVENFLGMITPSNYVTRLGFHRPYFNLSKDDKPLKKENINEMMNMLDKHLVDLQIPRSFLDKIYSIPPNDLFIFNIEKISPSLNEVYREVDKLLMKDDGLDPNAPTLLDFENIVTRKNPIFKEILINDFANKLKISTSQLRDFLNKKGSNIIDENSDWSINIYDLLSDKLNKIKLKELRSSIDNKCLNLSELDKKTNLEPDVFIAKFGRRSHRLEFSSDWSECRLGVYKQYSKIP